jgi:putative ABC transport system ATP-binding protein
MPQLIKMQKITKVYNNGDTEVAALKGIDLEINQGEFVAIMGASGSGKSTLMHIIGFLDRPTAGKYFFENQDVTDLDDNALAEIRNKKVGFVFQAFNLLARTSALDNVSLPMLYADSYSNATMQQRAMELLKEVALENRAGHHPSELSGGQQQRVAIARALVNNPSVIFADEPTGNLDSKSSVEIMDLFKKLNNEGRTLIFVTHEESIADYAKRIIKIKDGNIISDQQRN